MNKIPVPTKFLSGAALDYAVALIEKPGVTGMDSGGYLRVVGGGRWSPSTNATLGGKLAARAGIVSDRVADRDHILCGRTIAAVGATCGVATAEPGWADAIVSRGRDAQFWDGGTSEVAAMRCYVGTRIGPMVDIPQELA